MCVADTDNATCFVKLEPEAEFVYWVEEPDGVTAPHETLLIHYNRSTAKIGAFHRKPERADVVRI